VPPLHPKRWDFPLPRSTIRSTRACLPRRTASAGARASRCSLPKEMPHDLAGGLPRFAYRRLLPCQGISLDVHAFGSRQRAAVSGPHASAGVRRCRRRSSLSWLLASMPSMEGCDCPRLSVPARHEATISFTAVSALWIAARAPARSWLRSGFNPGSGSVGDSETVLCMRAICAKASRRL